MRGTDAEAHGPSIQPQEQETDATQGDQLGKDFTVEEVQQITGFLKSLTGDQPGVDYQVLPVHTAETPPPDPWIGIGAGTH